MSTIGHITTVQSKNSSRLEELMYGLWIERKKWALDHSFLYETRRTTLSFLLLTTGEVCGKLR